jgi:hypothetical protein
MKIQSQYSNCDTQTGGYTDNEKLKITFLPLFIATDQKGSAVPKYHMAGM